MGDTAQDLQDGKILGEVSGALLLQLKAPPCLGSLFNSSYSGAEQKQNSVSFFRKSVHCNAHRGVT